MASGPIPTSGSAAAAGLRARSDLRFTPQWIAGEQAWTVTDPIAGRYYQLRDEERFVLDLCDGRRSLDEIRLAFERRYAPRRLALRQLQAYLGALHGQGLLISDAPGQGATLLRRGDSARRRERLAAWSNPLAVRFGAIDPDRFLSRLYPLARWVFHPLALLVWVSIVASAAGLVALQFDEFVRRLPELRDLFAPGNLVWLAGTLATVKVLHELAHALTLQRLGGRCREIGAMLLVFTPCLYCDVSDAWRLTDRWRRAAVGAAGIACEAVLAALATHLWWHSEPGLLNTLCLNAMVVCSVGTVMFNGNPLLRYDGYYILSDLVNVPNLGQQAGQVVSRWAQQFFLGLDAVEPRLLAARGRTLLAAWWVASQAYRCLLLVAIVWLLHDVLRPYGAQAAAALVGLLAVLSMVVPPTWRAVSLLSRPETARRMNRTRLLVRGGAAAALVAGALAVPLPFRVYAPAELQPVAGRIVYVTVPGRLPDAGDTRPLAALGQTVVADQVLVVLENDELALEVARLEGEQDRLARRLAALEARRGNDPAAAAAIPATREALLDAQSRLGHRRQDRDRLSLRAPVAGTVLPPPLSAAPPIPEGELPVRVGGPLEERHRGCPLEAGEALCQIGDPARLEATLLVDQSQIEWVHVGQRVDVQLDEAPGLLRRGTVSRISQRSLRRLSTEREAGSVMEYRRDAQGTPRLAQTVYEVRVEMEPTSQPTSVNATGRARIAASPRSLGERLFRYVRSTFRIRW
jgi:putative peptide zinc metalloprotease protein